MRKHHLQLSAYAVAATFSILAGISDADAANINTHGAACNHYNAAEAQDIDYLTSGVRNLNASERAVVCSVTRAPLPNDTATAVFWVDGSNSLGSSTTCTLYSHNDKGVFLGSTTFTSSDEIYDERVTLPAEQVSTFAFVSLLCTLPGNGNGTLRGVTSVQ